MSNKSKAKAIADVWMSDSSRRWDWYETAQALIPGWDMIPRQSMGGILRKYRDQYCHVLAVLDERGVFLLRDGMGLKTRFKIATKDESDKPEIERRLVEMTKRRNGINGRIEKRIENLQTSGMLPPSVESKQIA